MEWSCGCDVCCGCTLSLPFALYYCGQSLIQCLL
uniref:Uncharacterized protein n=1 Tax=Rhizophora mucronata TaxID=61149 RepID=A0A2P2PWH7_RHIMU